ncbi:centrosomal protein of 112 kDa [Cebidichthys violaceus]|uniref:centrosomal protein of 112 kDa n=1 Tax=Cebidichthys violaceus TaxID=271503 RepID=UPI0035CB9774
MNRQEDSWDRLDTEFDHFLLDMKPYVLKHPNKTERQRCAVWIKKLCDPAACGSGVMGRKNRNMHTRLLLYMLKRGVLERPFTSKPEPGSLKTLPTYMSIYFDEPLSGRSAEHSHAGLPDWVTGELGGYTDDSLLKDRASSTPVAAHHRRILFEEKSPSRPASSSPLKQSPKHDARRVDVGLKADMSPGDSDLEARLNSWNLGIENPRYLRENPVPFSPIFKPSFGRNSTLVDDQGPHLSHSKEVYASTEMKIKVLESKHQEEKLKMQQRHDADVEKILDRKNGEIEETKSIYRAKQKESEEMIRKLERRVQSVLRESQVICESKEKQITELKKMSDQSADSLKNEWEKKLHAAVTEMEQEKFQLQKKHTESIQELLEDTNLRLAKMEAEYNARSHATEQTVRELEMRVKQQSVEVEKGNALRQRVTQEKAQLEIHIASISGELQEANRRHLILQKEKEQQSEQHEQTVQKLQAKHETDLSHLHKEHALSAAKSSEVMEDFEKSIALLKQQLQDSQHRKHQEVRDQGMKFHQEKDEVRINCEKKLIAELQTSVCDSKEEAVRLQQAMEKQLKECNVLWDEERRTITQHADRANKALQEKVESLQRQLHCSEKKLLSKELETDEKVTAVRRQYEERIKGLMPAELRQELEDTIASLKAQVNFLQKRASLLQEDLDACRSRR